MRTNYKLTRYACYTANIAVAVVANISPLLFLTFRELYGISFTQMGLLVVIGFSTQLAVDLLLSFYSHKVDLYKAVKQIPWIAAAGLLIYALVPRILSEYAYTGLVIGSIIFASASGLAEVLVSPVIAAIPADNPDKEISKLHSVFAWGTVGVVIISTLFLAVFGKEQWYIMAILWAIVPVVSGIIFLICPLPELKTMEKASNVMSMFKSKSFLLCFIAMIAGGASECTMSQWSSGFIEASLQIPKIWGDIFGVALFGVMLGTGRTLHAKFGGNINKIMTFGAGCATICYAVAGISDSPVLVIFACAITGLCTSMLWPGSLMNAARKFPESGVAIFALMAAAGDFGASVGPQILGSVTDVMMSSQSVVVFAESLGLHPEQIAMRIGLLVTGIFPLVTSILSAVMWKNRNKPLKK